MLLIRQLIFKVATRKSCILCAKHYKSALISKSYLPHTLVTPATRLYIPNNSVKISNTIMQRNAIRRHIATNNPCYINHLTAEWTQW